MEVVKEHQEFINDLPATYINVGIELPPFEVGSIFRNSVLDQIERYHITSYVQLKDPMSNGYSSDLYENTYKVFGVVASNGIHQNKLEVCSDFSEMLVA